MATTTNPTLPTGAVKPTSANQTTSNKATSLIESLVNQQFGLDKSSASALLELAESAAREATDLHGFTALINANWSLDEREKLVEWMWRVVYADGRLDDHEVHLMRKIQRLLHIPHRRFIATKLRHKPVDATTLDD